MKEQKQKQKKERDEQLSILTTAKLRRPVAERLGVVGDSADDQLIDGHSSRGTPQCSGFANRPW